MSNQKVTINLVVLNGKKYIRHCLDAILTQTYPRELIEINVLDNGSTDGTTDTIESETGLKINLIKSPKNLGMWPGQEELLNYSSGKYILATAVDVILDKDFIKNAVEIMEQDNKIGALESKIYKYDLVDNLVQKTNIIDTCGFKIFKSRRVVNIGHGEEDKGQFDRLGEIFAVEGACPFFLREALESCRMDEGITDKDFFWYGDDLELAWRMRMMGWKEIFAPTVIAWHDRQTSKSLKKHWWEYITRVPVRHQIPIFKRRLDWRNFRFTIVKNDYTINILRDLPRMLIREIQIVGYSLLFEPAVLLETGSFLKLLPKMIRKRREIMIKAKTSPEEIRRWFN